MKISIQHNTRHDYEGEVSFGDHSLFLRPNDSHRRRVHSFSVKTNPGSGQRWVRDAYGNIVLICNFGMQTSASLSFEARILVEVEDENPYDFILEPHAIAFPFDYTAGEKQALLPFLNKNAKPGELRVLDWFYSAVEQPLQHPSIVGFLSRLNEAVRRDIAYVARDEEGIQDPDLTLKLRSGSCRDMAVLFIAAVRQLGLAARFVSGYLYDPPTDVPGEHAFNRAVGSMHAWVEVYLPGAGWKGFDPTNGILANNYFMPTAVSHDPFAVNPIQGAYYSELPFASSMTADLKLEELRDE
ncbi:MAG TPA: transglutaminase family protein [Opitutales bacterium]|nr:transglutaminase family protein [Opitutales bacterium]